MHFHRDVLAICDTFARTILDPSPEDVFTGTAPLAFTFGLGRARPVPDALRGVVRADRHAGPRPAAWRPSRVTASRRSPPRRRCTARSCAADPRARLAAHLHLRRRAAAGERRAGLARADRHPRSWTASARRRCCTSSSPRGRRQSKFGVGRHARAGLRGPRGRRGDAPGRRRARSGAWPSAARPAAAISPIRGRRTTSSTGGTSPATAFRVDEDGYFWFEARNDDLIVSSGYNISPFEVETTLLEHDAVAECAVVASPDEDRGHVVKAFVVLASDVTGDAELVGAICSHTSSSGSRRTSTRAGSSSSMRCPGRRPARCSGSSCAEGRDDDALAAAARVAEAPRVRERDRGHRPARVRRRADRVGRDGRVPVRRPRRPGPPRARERRRRPGRGRCRALERRAHDLVRHRPRRVPRLDGGDRRRLPGGDGPPLPGHVGRGRRGTAGGRRRRSRSRRRRSCRTSRGISRRGRRPCGHVTQDEEGRRRGAGDARSGGLRRHGPGT